MNFILLQRGYSRSAAMAKLVGVVLSFGLLLCSPASQAQDRGLGERRVALVVGNAAYKNSPLKNPANDAKAIAVALRRMNFEVIERQNLGREAFALAAREFGDKLKGASVALFYFAGHGLQVRGHNYLVPVDADIAREDEVPYRSIDVNEVLDKMDSARTPINLVLLDACRNNPFARSFKLSQMGLAQMDAPAGTLIAFATSPGSVAQDGEGDNGLYTGALLKHMGAEALPIEQMLKRVRVDVVRASNNGQVPWESSSLNRDFAFANAAPAATAATAATAAANATPAINQSLAQASAPVNGSAANRATELALDLAFWDAVKTSSNPADYRAYLEQYPQGRFAALARLRAGVVATNPAANPNAGSTGVLNTPSASPVRTTASLRTTSPEGLYAAQVQAGQVQLIDVQKNSVIRSIAIDTALAPETVQFSPDGRWLALGALRQGQSVQLLFGVATGRVLWERPASAAQFDAQQARLVLRLPSGGSEAFPLNEAP